MNRSNLVGRNNIANRRALLRAIPLDDTPSCTSLLRESNSRFLGSMKKTESSMEFEFWLETLDTRETIPIRALLDSGADGCFINSKLVERFNLSTQTLDTPIPVRNADGSPSRGGPITHFTDVILFAPPSFRDRLHLEVATIVYDVIIGSPWLRRHNPKVNWKEGTMELLQDTTLSEVTADAEPQPLDDFYDLDPYEELIASIGLDPSFSKPSPRPDRASNQFYHPRPLPHYHC